MTIRLMILGGLLMILQQSCEWIDEPEQIPAYIRIDNINISTTTAEQGSNSHNILDAWIFVDNQLIGAFELPKSAPVLAEGERLVEVFAGISENGIRQLPEVYPFYNRYRSTHELRAGETLTLSPTLTYDTRTKFALSSGDFENGNAFSEDFDGNLLTDIEISTEDVFQGNYSGRIVLTGDNPYIEVGTSNPFLLPDPIASPIYVELNYKNNIPFEIGIVGYKNNVFFNSAYIVGILPTDTWKKMYINLGDEVGFMGAETYRISLRALKLPEVETGKIFLDNIKLLHF